MLDDWLNSAGLILLAVGFLGPFLLVFRVCSIMAVPSGRSVIFVTGNAKKLEEVRVKHLVHILGCSVETVSNATNAFTVVLLLFAH